MKKILFFVVISLFGIAFSFAQTHESKFITPSQKALNSRSDTIDILHYQINLEILDFTNKIINGNCVVAFTPKINNVGVIDLDLLELNVDSVVLSSNLLAFTHNDTLLKITLPAVLNIGDTASVTVYYNGSPQADNSGWGGFYFDNTYAYNLGVGFDANPHNYGRVWFPCFDNFVERATFEFNIITSAGKKAHCNGLLVNDSIIAGDTIVRTWQMNELIPTYLACVAVSDYATMHQNFNGSNGNIPVELVGRAPDTTNLKNSFVNLNNALDIYENNYGPYLWNKIGFVLVPFNSGAMEHATCIAYPRTAANGTLNFETLMAHEFAHHWWGDLVTCETAGDMWINEGMATYSEHLFTENMYGRAVYMNDVKNNHKEVLQFVHIEDNGFRALSNMDHAYTYGRHTYLKGASVAHNMRAYMGDSLFFLGLQSIQDSFQYKNINAFEFRDKLYASTNVDMTNFFNDWIVSPGFSHFAIDSTSILINGSNYDVTLFIQQKLRATTNFHMNVPLEITFYDANWNKFTTSIVASNQYSNTTVTIPFFPVLSILNEANTLNQARTDNQLVIKNPSSNQLQNLAMLRLTVSFITDSALLQLEHHWVAPDSIKNNVNNYRISSNRYWSFNGILPPNFKASARLDFDNRSTTGFLDDDLLSVNTDSIILVYRENAASDWAEYLYYTKTKIGSLLFGFMIIDSLLLGEYAFANSASAVSMNEHKELFQNNFKLFPNPTDNHIFIEEITPSTKNYALDVYDLSGRIIHQENFVGKTKINTQTWSKGNYIITVIENSKMVFSGKMVVQ